MTYPGRLYRDFQFYGYAVTRQLREVDHTPSAPFNPNSPKASRSRTELFRYFRSRSSAFVASFAMTSRSCLFLLGEKQYEIHPKLPLRVRQRLWMNGVVEVLNLNINRLIAHLENAAYTTPKRYDPSFIRRQLPIRREDWSGCEVPAFSRAISATKDKTSTCSSREIGL